MDVLPGNRKMQRTICILRRWSAEGRGFGAALRVLTGAALRFGRSSVGFLLSRRVAARRVNFCFTASPLFGGNDKIVEGLAARGDGDLRVGHVS